MPYRSRAQQAYMHIHHPAIAKRWDRHTTKRQFKALPKKVRRRRRK